MSDSYWFAYNLQLDPQQIFGIQTKNCSICDVRNLIENVDSNAKKTKITEAISYVKKLRRTLFNRVDFHMYDLKTLLNTNDEKKTGFITLKTIMKILRFLRIYANEEKIRLAVEHFEIFKEEKNTLELLVDLEKFWKMLHIQYPLPCKGVLTELPQGGAYKETTYRLLCSDREKPLIAENISPKSHKLSDGDLTRVGDLIAPDIHLLYGLSSSDFQILRPKEELRRIFKLLLPQNFEQVWQLALSKKHGDAATEMSVNEFRAVMQVYNQNLKL